MAFSFAGASLPMDRCRRMWPDLGPIGWLVYAFLLGKQVCAGSGFTYDARVAET